AIPKSGGAHVRVLLGKIHVGEKTIPGAGENDDAVLPVATHLVKGVPQLLVQAARVGTPGGGAAVVVDGDFENPVAAFEADKAVAVLVIGEPAHGVFLKVWPALWPPSDSRQAPWILAARSDAR